MEDTPGYPRADGPAIQLRISWEDPGTTDADEVDVVLDRATVGMNVTGMFLAFDLWFGDRASVLEAFGATGSDIVVDGEYLTAPIRDLVNLAKVADHISVQPQGQVATTLWNLARHLPDGGDPAVVVRGNSGEMRVRWEHNGVQHDEILPEVAVNALLASAIPVVATADSWGKFEPAGTSLGSAAPLLGRATVNPDGFVEIVTSVPQSVEAAPMRGLFRLDATHFGLPLAYADQIDTTAGFRWDGDRPVLDDPPPTLGQFPISLADHTRVDLRAIVDSLATHHAQVIAWDGGLGRRVCALAAVTALEAWPVTVICAPSGVWAWRRHLAMLGQEVVPVGTDAEIVRYDQIANGYRLRAGAAIIFDDLPGQAGENPQLRAQLRRLVQGSDSYRVVIAANWPTEPKVAAQLLSIVRPGEFVDDGLPLAHRYPLEPERRFADHEAVYVRRRDAATTDASRSFFRRSRVRLSKMTQKQIEYFTQARTGPAGTASGHVAGLIDAVNAGPVGGGMSPKLASAVQIAKDRAQGGRRVAVVCYEQRTATLLTQCLLPLRAPVIAPGGHSAGLPLAVFAITDGQAPDLTSFDVVVFCGYPVSANAIEHVVGEATSPFGPSEVIICHLAGSPDDQLAIIADRRRINGGPQEFAPLTMAECHEIAGRTDLGEAPATVATEPGDGSAVDGVDEQGEEIPVGGPSLLLALPNEIGRSR